MPEISGFVPLLTLTIVKVIGPLTTSASRTRRWRPEKRPSPPRTLWRGEFVAIPGALRSAIQITDNGIRRSLQIGHHAEAVERMTEPFATGFEIGLLACPQLIEQRCPLPAVSCSERRAFIRCKKLRGDVQQVVAWHRRLDIDADFAPASECTKHGIAGVGQVEAQICAMTPG